MRRIAGAEITSKNNPDKINLHSIFRVQGKDEEKKTISFIQFYVIFTSKKRINI